MVKNSRTLQLQYKSPKFDRSNGICLLIIFLILSYAAELRAQQSAKLQKADSLYQAFEYQKALDKYKAIHAEGPNNFTAVWRLSLLYSRIGTTLNSKEQRKDYFQKAHKLALEARQMDSTSVYSNYVMGMALGRKAMMSGPKEKVALARDIYHYARRALKADSSHAGSWYLLGILHLEVSNLNFAERIAARYLFGGFPGEPSNQKAINYIEKALKMDPSFITYWYDLARAYKVAGNKQKALHAINKALELDPKLPNADEILEKSKDLKATL